MYWLRIYELKVIARGHIHAAIYFNQGFGRKFVGPGFLNAVNRYYGYQIWR